MTTKQLSSIILTPTSSGSLGDQAMIDVIVTGTNKLFGKPPSVLPNSYNVRGPAHIIDFRIGKTQQAIGLLELLRAKRVLVVGADVMDGHYGASQVIKRLRVVEWAHRLGSRTRIMGCSFSESPKAEAINRLKQMPWLEILARDPVSKKRMERLLEREVTLVADVALLLEPEITGEPARQAADWITSERAKGRRVVALNLSGLVFSKLPDGTLERFSREVAQRFMREKDISVLVLPHDWRPGRAGDLAPCRTLHAQVSACIADRCYIVDEPIAAWEAKALAGMIDFALVCRMHFAIACLGQGTPPYCLVSAGKFEGLMEHFGLSGNLFDPSELITPEATLRPVDRMLTACGEDRKMIKAALPHVLALSRRNFDGL